jgi:hypothetical protein
MLLLTDGSVMCQDHGGNRWWKLVPDALGNYLNGSWHALAPMHHTRLYYASAVLRDGRVFVAGGEYSDAGSETSTAEIYDPLLDSWTVIAPPAGWSSIGDAPCCVLADGRVLIGNSADNKTAIYDPATGAWTAAASKEDLSSEESWVLLPDGSVVTAECAGHPKSERYLPHLDKWVSAGTVPVELVEASSIEIGPALLLPDGRVVAIGATSHTALYQPGPGPQAGSWCAGPSFPPVNGRAVGAKDAPACLLPNGKILCVAGPVDGVSGDYLGPTYFFEHDGHSLVRVTDPPNAGGVPYVGRMMLLPTGQALFAAGGPAIYAYDGGGFPAPQWRPRIAHVSTFLRASGVYTLFGSQLNGLSQAVGYGDDASSATNYPLVRLRSFVSGRVRYCRTFDHSTMGVAPGHGPFLHSTRFKVPFGVEGGACELTVIANGIASAPVAVVVAPYLFFPFVTEEAEMSYLLGSLADGPLWVLGPNGPRPVDPGSPDVAARAQAARAQIVGALQDLQALGREEVARRDRIASGVAPAVDPELLTASARPSLFSEEEEEEGEEREDESSAA